MMHESSTAWERFECALLAWILSLYQATVRDQNADSVRFANGALHEIRIGLAHYPDTGLTGIWNLCRLKQALFYEKSTKTKKRGSELLVLRWACTYIRLKTAHAVWVSMAARHRHHKRKGTVARSLFALKQRWALCAMNLSAKLN